MQFANIFYGFCGFLSILLMLHFTQSKHNFYEVQLINFLIFNIFLLLLYWGILWHLQMFLQYIIVKFDYAFILL
jgi:hypothetical protein